MQYKFGRREKRIDTRTFKLRRYLAKLPPIPAAIDWSGKVPVWGVDLNDTLGCCAIAAPAHMTMLWTANAGTEYVPPDSDVLAAYEAVGLYNPSDPSTDQGCVMLDVLNYWRNTGISGRKIQAYATVDCSNLSEIQAAIALFGAAYIGINVTQDDMDSFETQPVWNEPFDPSKIIGGHAIPLVAYDAQGFSCVTWGQVKQMSAAWLTARVDEAYMALSSDFISASGMAPSGFDMAALTADLSAL